MIHLVVLTTSTPHHLAYVRALSRVHPIDHVVLETDAVKPKFPVSHPFEEQRETYEWDTWFDGHRPEMGDFAATSSFGTANDPRCVDLLKRLAPDVMISFGTRKLGADILGICPAGALNLHGGDPERYRGLDSHLWSIYHRDRSGLITTLHRLNETLDDGEIVGRKAIAPPEDSAIFQLRRFNTEVCIELSLDALADFMGAARFTSTPQRKIGRYYSFMPAVLKEICARRYASFLKSVT